MSLLRAIALLALLSVGADRGLADEKPSPDKTPASETTTLKIPLSESQALVIQQPKAFRFRVTRDPDDGFRPALAFNAFNDRFKTHGLKLFIEEDSENKVENLDQLKSRLEKVGGRFAAGSVEKKVNAEELKVTAKGGLGCYCVLTDASLAEVKEPRPGDFAYITFAFVKLDGFVVHGRLYSNSKDDANFRSILQMMESLSLGQPDPPKPDEPPAPPKGKTDSPEPPKS